MAYQGTEAQVGNLESRSANSAGVDIGMEMSRVAVEIVEIFEFVAVG